MFVKAASVLSLAAMASAVALPTQTQESVQYTNPAAFFGKCVGTKDPNFIVSRGMLWNDMQKMTGPPDAKGNVLTDGIKHSKYKGTLIGNVGSSANDPIENKTWDGKPFSVSLHPMEQTNIVATFHGNINGRCATEGNAGSVIVMYKNQKPMTLDCVKLADMAPENVEGQDLQCTRQYECWKGANSNTQKGGKRKPDYKSGYFGVPSNKHF